MQKEESSGTKWIPAAEAARILATTRLNILMHIKRDRLTGLEIAGDWQVSRASLDALVSERPEGVKRELCASRCPEDRGCGGCP